MATIHKSASDYVPVEIVDESPSVKRLSGFGIASLVIAVCLAAPYATFLLIPIVAGMLDGLRDAVGNPSVTHGPFAGGQFLTAFSYLALPGSLAGLVFGAIGFISDWNKAIFPLSSSVGVGLNAFLFLGISVMHVINVAR